MKSQVEKDSGEKRKKIEMIIISTRTQMVEIGMIITEITETTMVTEITETTMVTVTTIAIGIIETTMVIRITETTMVTVTTIAIGIIETTMVTVTIEMIGITKASLDMIQQKCLEKKVKLICTLPQLRLKTT
jgi:hypothetical protein